jgi:ABC-type multidrug transport system fused ATPase/permease subunit
MFFSDNNKLRQLIYIKKIMSRKYKVDLFLSNYLLPLRYSIITGFGAVAMILLQNPKQGPNLVMSIIYGFLGPYFIREKFKSLVSNNLKTSKPKVAAEFNEKLDSIVRERKKSTGSTYDSELKKFVEYLQNLKDENLDDSADPEK